MCVFSPLYFPLETSGQFTRLGVQGERGGGYNQPIASLNPTCLNWEKETKYILNNKFNLNSNGNVDFTLKFLVGEKFLCFEGLQKT